MKEENQSNLPNQHSNTALTPKEQALLKSINHESVKDLPNNLVPGKSTWSLHEKTTGTDDSSSDIFSFNGKLLEPMQFSNGKTQADIVDETLEAMRAGHRIIFIHGVCGTGKSSIALNIAKNFKKTSIIVPIKSLQEQYEIDYTKKKFIMKNDNSPLKISVIKGRANFECPFDGCLASERHLPCHIEIREKNAPQIFEYLEQNPHTDKTDFESITDVRRINVAPACPYWSPILPSKTNSKVLENAKKTTFDTISGKEFALFERSKNCKYFMQYKNYATSDVLIFNSMKYLIETAMGRKPLTDIEIIDECDEFLDNFSTERQINLNRLVTALTSLHPTDSDKKTVVKDLIHKVNDILFNSDQDVDCEKIENTPMQDIIALILENPNLAEDEEQNYYNNALEIARSFESILHETYISTERIKPNNEQEGLFGKNYNKEERVVISLVTINLAEKFKELVDKNKQLVLMSGTLHSAEVLRDVFGIENFKIIQAEEKMPGTIKVVRTGLEKNCAYSNFQDGTLNRDKYLKILDHCISIATKPTLVHVNAFSDLPTNAELSRLKLDNLISREKLSEIQAGTGHTIQIESFVGKRKEILFTTKCSRGVDFPGDICNSIVLTKFPYPNISSLFWKILRKEQPQKFREFYTDKANRELIQKIARGVRFKGDNVELLSPDIRVLNAKFE